jgi:hypothetical protein
MSEFYIGRNIIVDETETMLPILEAQSGIDNIDIKDIAEFVDSQKGTKFYFDSAMNGKDEMSKDIVYLWIDTGFKDKYGKPLFISLINHKGYFTGHFIGTSSYLAGKIADYFPENRNKIWDNESKFKEKYKRKSEGRDIPDLKDRYKIKAETKVKETKATKQFESNQREIKKYWEAEPAAIAEEVSKTLLINNWKSTKGVDRYLKIIGTRIFRMTELGETRYCFLNKLKDAVVNTGLVDKYGSFIYMIYRKHIAYQLYVPYKIVGRKAELFNEGFVNDDKTDLPPITFNDDTKLTATLDRFDITPKALSHIIEERRERFPESAKNLSDIALATKIKTALELGLTLQKVDPSYAKPSYSTTTNTISWFLPLHINRDYNEEPEMVLVIRQSGYYYEIKTILPYDDSIKDKITDMAMYGRSW